ncbi:MAG: alpha/beta fold hydrolase [Pseudomonadota bacterium]
MQQPEWFRNLVNRPRQTRFTQVDGARIHFDVWGTDPDKPHLLFVHGNGAQSHWWDFIAPAFIDRFNPVAMDMSGNGDSEHRTRYTATGFANEIMGVLDALGNAPAIVVGHSFGGTMTRIAAYLHGEALTGIVLVDSMVSTHRTQRPPPPLPRTQRRFYPSLEAAKRRFRLRPPQPCANDYIIDYIAEHSVRGSPDGFYFKLDQTMFARFEDTPGIKIPDAATTIRETACPVGFILGDNSRFFPAEARALVSSLIEPDLLRTVPGAWHHVFLDQPLLFIDALGEILENMKKGD